MPKCRNCNKEITKFDKDMCPFCGTTHPFDVDNYETKDITRMIDNEGFNEKKLFKRKSLLCYSLLCIFLGTFGAHLLYLKKYINAVVIFIFNTFFVVGAGFLLAQLKFFSEDQFYFYFIVSYLINFTLYIIMGIIIYFKGDVVDSNNNALK